MHKIDTLIAVSLAGYTCLRVKCSLLKACRCMCSNSSLLYAASQVPIYAWKKVQTSGSDKPSFRRMICK
jgi:hypothetical protein